LLILLTACERPLGSNQSETAEQAAEATAVAETVEDVASAEAAAEAEADGMAEPGEAAQTESGDEAAEQAESSDANVGGGTPETAADEAAAEVEDAEQASTGEDASETAAETVEEEATGEEADAATEGEATGEATTAEAAETEATEDEEVMAAEEDSVPAGSTLPATHTVAPGENLYRIGLKYGMSWVVLASYNHLPNANYVRVGQVLQIPGGGTPAPEPTPTPPDETGHIDYVVQWGDTLNKIGLRFGVSWVEIAEANGLVNPNLIYAGQVLKIPTTEPEAPPAETHTVKSGETLYRISLQYGVHWLAIAQTNKIAPPYVIYPGQVLAIPGG
jgi:LysM repeat protein